MSTRDHEIIDIEELPLDKEIRDSDILNKETNVCCDTDILKEECHRGGPITTCAISPYGQCLATYSAETESVAVWSIEHGERHLVALFETSVEDRKKNVTSLVVSDDRCFIFDNGMSQKK